MTSILSTTLSGLDLPAARQQFQRDMFQRLSAGASRIGAGQWQAALQNLPGLANAAGQTSTATGSAVAAAFRSLDSNADGQLSQAEFGTALDRMLDRARQRRGATPLDAQLLGQQGQASGGVAAPDLLRRMVLGYGATSA